MKAGIFVLVLSLSIAASRVLHTKQKPNVPQKPKDVGVKNVISTQPVLLDERLWERSGKFQGDIILPKSVSDRNGISQDRIWPWNTLVYKYGPNLSYEEKMQIYYAFMEIYERTNCIGFREAETDDTDYILIENKSDGCYAHVGVIGGEQKMNIQTNGCSYKGTIMHETLHSLGFLHMQSDPSRDDYVWIYWENIEEQFKFAFDLIKDLNSYGVGYDLKSIMHYGRTAFSKNGQPTIVALSDYYMELGGDELTDSDVLKIRRLYGCE